MTALVVLWVGCGAWPEPPRADDDDTPPRPCLDQDGDGYGNGVLCDGSDCDDADPDVQAEEQCALRCAPPNDIRPGCPCSGKGSVPCYDAAEETLDVGRCRAGARSCEAGLWSVCEGEVLPLDEFCDEIDDDCDGEVDEGVTDECGGCGGMCERSCHGVGHEAFVPDATNSSGVTTGADGALMLSGAAPGEYRYAEEHGGIRCWTDVVWDASAPDGAGIEIAVRAVGRGAPDPLPDWTAVATIPPDVSAIDLSEVDLELFTGERLEVRLTLVPGTGESPRFVSICIDSEFCDKI